MTQATIDVILFDDCVILSVVNALYSSKNASHSAENASHLIEKVTFRGACVIKSSNQLSTINDKIKSLNSSF